MNKVMCPDCMEIVEKQEFCELCESRLMLNDRYFLLKFLGRNIGVTYLAFDENTYNKVVIKELSVMNVKFWKDEELFRREAETLMAINNPQIPDFIEYFEIMTGRKVKYYTVMEFIEGDGLDKILKDNKTFNDNEVVDLIKQISRILDYLHSLNPPVIHRDIKPSNIIKRKHDNKYVLIDFGSVANLLKTSSKSTVSGTYGYMPPEQFLGKISVKSDYYSLGVVALELLTGKKNKEFIDGINLNWKKADISPYMKNILKNFLARDLRYRIGSYQEFLDILNHENTKQVVTSLNEDKQLLRKMHEELKSIERIRKKYNLKDKISFASLILGIFLGITSYFIAGIGVAGGALLSLYYLREHRIKKQKGFLPEYFSELTEIEVVFLEMILKHDKKSFVLNKAEFYSLYQKAVSEGKLDINILMKYSGLYKKNEEFKNLIKKGV